jgi:hypothetical protein
MADRSMPGRRPLPAVTATGRLLQIVRRRAGLSRERLAAAVHPHACSEAEPCPRCLRLIVRLERGCDRAVAIAALESSPAIARALGVGQRDLIDAEMGTLPVEDLARRIDLGAIA